MVGGRGGLRGLDRLSAKSAQGLVSGSCLGRGVAVSAGARWGWGICLCLGRSVSCGSPSMWGWLCMNPCISVSVCPSSEAPPSSTMRGPGAGLILVCVCSRVGELHYLLISTSVPLWQSQASVLPPVSWRVSSDRELSWGLAASTIWPGWCWGRWGNLSQDTPLGPQA